MADALGEKPGHSFHRH